MNVQVCVDFSKEPVPVLKIHLDHMLENAPIHAITAAGAENLDMSFDLLDQLKDDSEKLMSTFRDRLRIKTAFLVEHDLCTIPFQSGARITSCFCLATISLEAVLQHS